MLYDELCECQTRTTLDPTAANMEAETIVYQRWQLLADLEEKYLKQKSKLHWLNIGDGNNRYFHQAVKNRERKNSIREIQRSDGSITVSQEEIKKEAESFFS